MKTKLPLTWKNVNGTNLLIRDMETPYLISLVRYIRKKAAKAFLDPTSSNRTIKVRISSCSQFLKAFEKELRSRKDSKKFVAENRELFQDFGKPPVMVNWGLIKIRKGDS